MEGFNELKVSKKLGKKKMNVSSSGNGVSWKLESNGG